MQTIECNYILIFSPLNSPAVGRNSMNIQDVVIAMDDMMISIPEIIEYTKHIEPLPFAHKKSIPKYPGPFAGIVISERI